MLVPFSSPIPRHFHFPSLLRSVTHDTEHREFVISMQGSKRTIQDGATKLHFDYETGDLELYDLLADPHNDLAVARPEEVRHLSAALSQWTSRNPAGDQTQNGANALSRQLRALGCM